MLSTVVASQFIDPSSLKPVLANDVQTEPVVPKIEDLSQEKARVNALQEESEQLLREKEELDEQIRILQVELEESIHQTVRA